MRNLLVVAVMSLGAFLAGAANPHSAFGELSMDYVTPHVQWAKPLAGGPLRAVVVSPMWSGRESVELAQRADIVPLSVMVAGYHQFYPTKSPLYVGPSDKAVLQAARDQFNQAFDVIVIGKLKWASLPEQIQAIVISSVRRGKGLVYVNPGKDAFWDGLAWKALAGDSQILRGVAGTSPAGLEGKGWEGVVKVAGLGKGRVVRIDYPGAGVDYEQLSKNPWAHPLQSLSSSVKLKESPPDYEQYMSLLARAACWAAGRVTENTIKSVSLPLTIPRAGAATLELVLAGASPLTLSLDVRNDKGMAGEVVAHKEFPVASGAAHLPLPLPPGLSPGKYHVDVRLEKGGAVCDWTSRDFKIVKAPGDVNALKDLMVGGGHFVSGGDFAGELSLAAPIPAGQAVRLGIRDFYGRLLWRATLTGGATAFSGRLAFPKSLSANVRAELLDQDGKVVQELERSFPVWDVANDDDFAFLLWTNPNGSGDSRPLSQALAAYRGLGVSADYDPTWSPNPETTVLKNNLKLAPIEWRVTVVQDKCLSSPAHRKEVGKYFQGKAMACRPYDPLLISLGDETWHWGGKDHLDCSACLTGYRAYLWRVYGGDLKKLNAAWGASLASFDDATFSGWEDIKRGKQVARWINQAMFFQWLFADFYRHCAESIKAVCPKAFVGDEGSMTMESGAAHETAALAEVCDLVQAYDGSAGLALIVSFAKASSLRGVWLGNYPYGRMDEDYVSSRPWDLLFMGMNSVWWWMGFPADGCDSASAIKPDMTPIPAFNQLSASVRELRKGPSTLLLKAAEPLPAPVAILYSPASIHAAAVLEGDGGAGAKAIGKLVSDFDRLGVNYRFVSDSGLVKGGYAVLVLPKAYALSDQALAQVKGFAASGGVVVADVPVGQFDLCGLSRGKGELVGTRELKDLPDALWPVKIVDGGGERLANTLCRVFQDGGSLFVGVDRDIPEGPSSGGNPSRLAYRIEGGAKHVKLDFPRQGYLYDVRRGRLLGHGAAIETKLGFAPELYAVLPYKVEGIRSDGLEKSYSPGAVVCVGLTVVVSGGTPDTHVFHVQVNAPDGSPVPCLERNLVAKGGKAELEFQLAFDAPPGNHTLKVRDVASGTEAVYAIKNKD